MTTAAADSARYTKEISEYLKDKFGDKIRDKIIEKIAKKLGYATAGQFMTGSNPAGLLSKFSVGYLKMMKFEGDIVSYGNRQGSPYDPKSNEDAYVEYLLYSWARLGKPGYKYENVAEMY